MEKVVLNGTEIEYDFTDADNWDAMKDAVRVLEDYDSTHEYNPEDPADSIRHTCSGYNEFFDTVFGEGTSKKLFHGKNSLKEHKKAFEQIIDIAYGQMEDATDFSSTFSKYSPERAQRQPQDFHRPRKEYRRHR